MLLKQIHITLPANRFHLFFLVTAWKNFFEPQHPLSVEIAGDTKVQLATAIFPLLTHAGFGDKVMPLSVFIHSDPLAIREHGICIAAKVFCNALDGTISHHRGTLLETSYFSKK